MCSNQKLWRGAQNSLVLIGLTKRFQGEKEYVFYSLFIHINDYLTTMLHSLAFLRFTGKIIRRRKCFVRGNFRRGIFSSASQNFVIFPRRSFPRLGI